MNITMCLTRTLFIFLLSFAGVVHAGRSVGISPSYQINQMNQIIQSINQMERMQQNIIQMDQVNQLIQMNQLEQMNQNILQRHQIYQDINQINQMNQMLNIQQQLMKQKKARLMPPENSKPSTHKSIKNGR